MTLAYDAQRRRLISESTIVGIAGSATAAIAPGVVAEVDLATQSVVGIQITRMAGARQLGTAVGMALDTGAQDPFIEDAIVRIVLATVLGRETSGASEEQWRVDHVVARLELGEEIPELAVIDGDPDVARAVDILQDSAWAKVIDDGDAWELQLQRCIDTVKRARPGANLRSTGDMVVPGFAVLGGPAVTGVPVPVLVAFWADRLQLESYGTRPVCAYADGILTVSLRVSDSDRFDQGYFCFLIDPGHDYPVIAIGQLHPVENGLTSQLRVPGRLPWARHEVVIAPTSAVDGVTRRSSRDLALVGCDARTAIRLAQKGVYNLALARIDIAIRAAIDADLGPTVEADLADIRQRIAARTYRRRFLDDF